MNDLLELYREMNNHYIIYELFSLNDSDSISVMDDYGDCYICIDPKRIHNIAQEKALEDNYIPVLDDTDEVDEMYENFDDIDVNDGWSKAKKKKK